MDTATYQLNPLAGVVRHAPSPVFVVRDDARNAWWEQEYQLQIAMQVRSGDYFETLATRLDGLSQTVGQYDEVLAAELDQVVKDLLYLQRRYTIHKKA